MIVDPVSPENYYDQNLGPSLEVISKQWTPPVSSSNKIEYLLNFSCL